MVRGTAEDVMQLVTWTRRIWDIQPNRNTDTIISSDIIDINHLGRVQFSKLGVNSKYFVTLLSAKIVQHTKILALARAVSVSTTSLSISSVSIKGRDRRVKIR